MPPALSTGRDTQENGRTALQEAANSDRVPSEPSLPSPAEKRKGTLRGHYTRDGLFAAGELRPGKKPRTRDAWEKALPEVHIWSDPIEDEEAVAADPKAGNLPKVIKRRSRPSREQKMEVIKFYLSHKVRVFNFVTESYHWGYPDRYIVAESRTG